MIECLSDNRNRTVAEVPMHSVNVAVTSVLMVP